MYVCMYLCMYVRMYACMYMCMQCMYVSQFRVCISVELDVIFQAKSALFVYVNETGCGFSGKKCIICVCK